MSYLGADVSANQPPTLPWDAWVSSGLQVAIVQTWHFDHAEPLADIHLAHALLARVPHLGAYSWLGHALPLQCASFLAALNPAYTFCALDVEQANVDASDVLTWCGWYDAHSTLPLYLYGNYSRLVPILNERPELKRYPVWWAEYGSMPPNATQPPYPHHHAPADLHVAGWQWGGDNAIWPPYSGAIDRSEWYEIPGVSMPKQSTGCLFGFHTQGNSSAVPLANAYAAAGAPIAIMLADEDAGKAIDTQATIKTRITRLQFPETGDDHDFEGGGSGRLGWSEEKVNRYLAGIEWMLTVRLGIGELNAATHLQLGCNEWDAQDVAEWLRTLDILARVVDKVNEVSARLAAKGLTHPLRLALPAFNAGTPKTWAMYQAIAAHPIWPKLAAQGGCALFHEGIAFGQPFTQGEGQPIDPAAPLLPGAGQVNFRAFYLLDLLAQRGIEIDWAVGEWYDGRKRTDDVEARVDNMIRHDGLLAASPWSQRCLGYCTYELTNDPGSPWYQQDATQIWKHPRWKDYYVSVKDRVNGADDMADIKAALVAIATAQSQLDAAKAALTDTTWHPGDVALAVANPIQLFDAAHNASGAPRANVSYDIDIVSVSADGQWLQVNVAPALYARAADLRHK